MIYFLVVLHVIVCLFLIGVVLLQQGKSADLAGAFGGQGSQTAFGPRGAANLLTKLTTWGAVLFMVISISLTVLLARTSGDHSVLSGPPTTSGRRRVRAGNRSGGARRHVSECKRAAFCRSVWSSLRVRPFG